MSDAVQNLTIRASSLPRIWACPASRMAPETPIDDESPAAILGTAVHAVMSRLIQGDEKVVTPALRQEVAEKHGLEDDSTFGYLCWAGLEAWKGLRDFLDIHAIEAAMEADLADGIRLQGHADLVAVERGSGSLTVLDWKSGQVESDPQHQLKAYLWLALYGGAGWVEERPEICKAVVVWLRSRTIDVLEITPDELDQWAQDLTDRMGRDFYGPGEHCLFCPRQLECPARGQLVSSTVQDLVPLGEGSQELAPATLARLYPRVCLVRKALEKYDAVLRGALANMGSLPIGDGRVLSLQPITREHIRLKEAWALLMEEFGGEVQEPPPLIMKLGDALEVKKSKVLEEVAKGAPRGQKTKRKEAVMVALREAHAVTETTYQRLTAKKETKE